MSVVDLPAVEQPRSRRAALRELALCFGLYALYDVTRLWARGGELSARRHALSVLHAEQLLGIDVERAVNHAVTPITWLSVFSSYWYATMHFIITPLVLVLLYRHRFDVYRIARTALMGATFLALVGYFFFPTAPPRLLTGYDYLDTVESTSRYGWWPGPDSTGGHATNQFAAMPSMHVGWALWVSLVIAILVRRRWLKVLAFAYVATTLFVVVATANHWVLDAVAGAALVLVCWWFSARQARLSRPAELSRVPGQPLDNTAGHGEPAYAGSADAPAPRPGSDPADERRERPAG
ncbi:phosphatase PAP2 family protein [Cellulomonas alba]|uniref:Phosphatase PAP2 family protein n=1 Tax=Cellulomonas alba TaxID=3053467 RepID=A0ABT7SBD8_9CELL|nr:phosphatase PAP2 family protein [Cellulomonas alba]MDM7853490.1 phosphatase PAP2 family protein [Cellulomonas alba]